MNEELKKALENFHEKCGIVDKLPDLMKEIKTLFLNQLEQGVSNTSDSDFVDIARAIGRYLAYRVKMNAIRRFLTALRKIEVAEDFSSDMVSLIRPKLAYAVGRSGREEKIFMENFMDIFDPILEQVAKSSDKKLFEKALKFMESIIAYYKYYGGDSDKGGSR